jgi:D-amino-acid dehydrogenase
VPTAPREPGESGPTVKLSKTGLDADVVVVGAGAVGACIALHLVRRGASVILVDAVGPGAGASFGNAGLVVPSYVVPLASAASVLEGLKSLFAANAPLRIRMRRDIRAAAWWMRFIRSCSPSAVAASMAALHSLAQQSLVLHEQLACSVGGYGFAQKGWLYLYQSRRGLDRGVHEAAKTSRFGVESQVLSAIQARSLAQVATEQVVGGIHHPDDAQLQPDLFVQRIAEAAILAGARLLTSLPVVLRRVARDRVEVVNAATNEVFRADTCVVAAGVASVELGRTVGLELPIQRAKGYSITIAGEQLVPLPLMLAEAHTVVTPMGDATRLTTGLDLVGTDDRVDTSRVRIMQAAARDYLGVDIAKTPTPWVGFRPMTPDSLPIVGRSSRYPNLVIASGHGTLGITLAPATGRFVADLLNGSSTADVTWARSVAPARFGL